MEKSDQESTDDILPVNIFVNEDVLLLYFYLFVSGRIPIEAKSLDCVFCFSKTALTDCCGQFNAVHF